VATGIIALTLLSCISIVAQLGAHQPR
jgi:hypothetical protein